MNPRTVCLAMAAGTACLVAGLGASAARFGSWRAAAPMPIERTEVAAAALAGRIYVIGGGVKPGASRSNLNEVFDPGS